jgi:hypothetical protein
MNANPSGTPCSLCGRGGEHYPDLVLFHLNVETICGNCAKRLAKQAIEIDERADAVKMLDKAKDTRLASLSDLVSGMAGSIHRDPGEWWTDGYKLMHANGVRVWIANGRSYLKITIPERGEFTLPWWQRRKLWRAVASWRGRPLPDFWHYNPVRPEEPEHRV